MYANLQPFSLMGKIAEKDLHATTTRKRDFIDDKEALVVMISEAGKSGIPKIRVPTCRGDGGDGGGCTTPKAADRSGESDLPKGPPPPPRKPKSVASKKRKVQRVLLDLSNEIESLFPSNILRDFKIKKVRAAGCPQNQIL